MAVPSTILASVFSSSTPTSTTSDIFDSLPTVTSEYDESSHSANPIGPSDNDLDPNDADPLTIKSESFIYKYYFLFVILGVVFIIAILFWARQRRRRRKQIYSHRGRDALARDVERWQQTDPHSQGSQPSSARRWLQRYNRFTTRGRVGENEGLNEFGEAPPPYKAQEAALEAGQRTTESQTTVSVPLMTLSRNVLGKPPDYNESINPPPSQNSFTGAHPASKDTQLSSLLPERPAPAAMLGSEGINVENSTQITHHNSSSETK